VAFFVNQPSAFIKFNFNLKLNLTGSGLVSSMKKARKPARKRRVRYDDVKPAAPESLQETPLTMLELRQNAAGIIEGLKSGVKYRLTYRGKTVGTIVPAQSAADEIPPDDPIFHMEDYVGKGPKGPKMRLTNEEIDRIVYGY
jgi:antitoxin (DNA-binding transcriptional repressor) of toxin-antitoxin stability system